MGVQQQQQQVVGKPPACHYGVQLRGLALLPKRRAGSSRMVSRSSMLLEPVLHSHVPMEIARRAITATLLDPPAHSASFFIIQGAPNGATVWFTTVCALSVALAALCYNLFSILAQFHLFTAPPEEQKRQVLYGVDVTGSRFFQDERVLAAVEFAAAAHAGQVRKTGEPYVSHCLETALIVEHNLPPAAEEQDRYAWAIAAAVLHDVIDDTSVDLSAVKAKFGGQVASMVGCVSKLSNMNQLLRRGKRKGWAEYGPQHFKALRKMIVDMVFEEPLVILIKLADRLHNMRTVFVLKPEKQRAVAEETLEVWCTMAECLGWDALKSEMEDLCFAVLQPKEYCTLRAQLDRIWSLPSLAVVVDQADSASLPANALAPAPPLTARSRRAAAATAARKAAAAAKAAVDALATKQQEVAAEQARAQAALPPSPAAQPQPVMPLFPWLAKLMPPRQPSLHARGAAAPPLPSTTSTVDQPAAQPATEDKHASASLPSAHGSVAPLLSSGDDLNLGIRIVSTASSDSELSGGSQTGSPQWDLVSWSLETPSSSSSSSSRATSSNSRGDAGSSEGGLHGSATHRGVRVQAWPGESPKESPSKADVHKLTAASVARFVSSNKHELLQQQQQQQQQQQHAPQAQQTPGSQSTARGPSGSASRAGWQPSASALSTLTEADRKLLHEHMQRLAEAEWTEQPWPVPPAEPTPASSRAAAAQGMTPHATSSAGISSASATGSVSSPVTAAAPASRRGGVATLTAPAPAITATAVATAPISAQASATSTAATAAPSTGGGVSVALKPAPVATATVTATLPRPKPAITSLLSADELEAALASSQRPKPAKGSPSTGTASSPTPLALPPVTYTKQQLELGLAGLSKGSANSSGGEGQGVQLKEQQERLRSLVSTVVPFDSVNFKDTRNLAISTRRGLEVLDQCAELLYNEVQLRSSGAGLSLQIQGRLKSLYSVYKKMVRKGCSVAEVYDARALRVIVGDDNGTRMRDAIDTCYKLVSAVHSIWKPIPFEFDDYIANPKPSGYQALHTAVKGPGGVPMEVQIKTSSMHELAEYGAAAHWVYKEYSSSSIPLPITSMTPSMPGPTLMTQAQPMPSASSSRGSSGSSSSSSSSGAAAHRVSAPVVTTVASGGSSTGSSAGAPSCPLTLPVRLKGRGWEGQPVLRVAKDKLRYGVVVSAEEQGQRLLVAVRAGPTSNQYPTRVPDYSFYRSMIEYVQAKGWVVPGHSDFNIRLEEFVLANDGRFHRKDHMGYVQPGEVLTLLEGYEEDADALARAAHAATNPVQHVSNAAHSTSALGHASSTNSSTAGQGHASSSHAVAELSAAPAAQVHQQEHAAQAPAAALAEGKAAGPAQQQQHQPQQQASMDMAAAQQRRQMQQAYLRTQQLRTMIEWGRAAMGRYHKGGSEPGDEVSVLVWPGGTIEHWARGTTVGQVVRAKGITTLAPLPEPPDIRPSATAIAGGDDGWLAMYSRQHASLLEPPPALVNVNNRLVPEDTVLNDGDLVILAREKVKI